MGIITKLLITKYNLTNELENLNLTQLQYEIHIQAMSGEQITIPATMNGIHVTYDRCNHSIARMQVR